MNKKEIAANLADVLEKELFTQGSWESRLATVWLRLEQDPTLELCERLVEHAIQTNAPKIDIGNLPHTVGGFREIKHVVKGWMSDLQHKYDTRELDNALGMVNTMVESLIDGALQLEASTATDHFYNTHISRVFNQFCLDHKVYGFYPELRQMVIHGYAPMPFQNPNRWRFGYGHNDVDSRVYINARLHQVLTTLRDPLNPLLSEVEE